MKYECMECGACCRQRGALRFLPQDIERISDYKGLSFNEFCNEYNVTDIDGRLYFIETDEDCLFLDGNKCSIEPVKPWFCANYIPFVDGPNSPIYEVCPGIGHGKDWSDEEIKAKYEAMIEKFVIKG